MNYIANLSIIWLIETGNYFIRMRYYRFSVELLVRQEKEIFVSRKDKDTR